MEQYKYDKTIAQLSPLVVVFVWFLYIDKETLSKRRELYYSTICSLFQFVVKDEWINVYKIHPLAGANLDFTLNIIDTPGLPVSDMITPRKDFDEDIVDLKLNVLSIRKKEVGLNLNAICFVVKTPDRQSSTDKSYMYRLIMSLFGKNLESNICTIITFVEEDTSSKDAVLEEFKLPKTYAYEFSNSALFDANNDKTKKSSSAPNLWQMNSDSFKKFIERIRKLEKLDFDQTEEVLDGREKVRSLKKDDRFNKMSNEIDEYNKWRKESKQNPKCYEKLKSLSIEQLPEGNYVRICCNCKMMCPRINERVACGCSDSRRNHKNHKNYPFYIAIDSPIDIPLTDIYECQYAVEKTRQHWNNIESMSTEFKGLIESWETVMNLLSKKSMCSDSLFRAKNIDQVINNYKSLRTGSTS